MDGKLARVRKLIDNLPELMDSLHFVKFTIFMTGNYRPFIRQCLSNTIHLSDSTLGCVLQYRRHVSRSGRATGMISKSKHHNGSRAKDCRRTQEPGVEHSGVEYKAFAEALSWSNFGRIYHRMIVCFYLYHLCKNLLIDSIGYDSGPTSAVMHNFRYLDCLLLGRFRFVGRTNKISAEIANVFLLAFLIYRWLIHSTVPKFKFYAHEFLMSSHAEVLKQELKTNFDGPLSSSRQAFYFERSPGMGARQSSFGHLLKPTGGGRQREGAIKSTVSIKTLGVNSIYYLRSPFDLEDSKWILRLNRTSKSWRALNLCTKLLTYWSVLVFFIWFALMYYTLAGSILTNMGFEMSYPSCVAWLRDMQTTRTTTTIESTNASNYSHIYLAPKVLAHEIRIDDLPASISLDPNDFPSANLYNFARISFDIIENHMLYLEFILIFIAQFYLLAISSIDVILNALEIKTRLKCVLEKLANHKRIAHEHEMRDQCYAKFIEAHRQFEVDSEPLQRGEEVDAGKLSLLLGPSARHLSRPVALAGELDEQLGGSETNQFGDSLTEEIADLQAILADHFDTITRGYNLFVSFFVNFLLSIWLTYTLVICTWIGAVKSRAIEWEFLIAESGGTVFALILLSGAAIVRSQNVQLYPLIARAMALDSVTAPTKIRWTIILKYFHPKPFFCFTIFGSTEVSLLLCLKLLSWILSAFILLANFYYMNRF